MSDIVKKKVAVIGSRDFDDKKRLYDILTLNYDRIEMIVSGGARGADTLAVQWAADYGIPYLVFPALWYNPFTGENDRGAGFRRNVRIVDACDLVIAFWDGKSRGTQNSLDLAEMKKKPVRIYRFNTPEKLAREEKDHVEKVLLDTQTKVDAHATRPEETL